MYWWGKGGGGGWGKGGLNFQQGFSCGSYVLFIKLRSDRAKANPKAKFSLIFFACSFTLVPAFDWCE